MKKSKSSQKLGLVIVNLNSRRKIDKAATILGVSNNGCREDVVNSILEKTVREIKLVVNQINKEEK